MESLDKCHTRLLSLAKTCEFKDPDYEIERQIIIAGTSSRIRNDVCKDPTYTLKHMLLDSRRSETSQFQASEINLQDAQTATAYHLTTQRTADKPKRQRCGNCGGQFTHKGIWPTLGKDCNKCGVLNHSPSVVRGGKPHKRHKNNNRTHTAGR